MITTTTTATNIILIGILNLITKYANIEINKFTFFRGNN